MLINELRSAAATNPSGEASCLKPASKKREGKQKTDKTHGFELLNYFCFD